MIELNRKIYKDMYKWKDDTNGQVLEVEGARQVGKTYAIRKFAKENFNKSLYINCAEATGEKFIHIIRGLKAEGHQLAGSFTCDRIYR